MQQLKIENHELNTFITFIKDCGLLIEHEEKKNKLAVLTAEQEKIALLRYSIYQEFNSDSIFVPKDFFNHIILGVRSGLAGVHCYENQELIDHKVFRAYMVRKKQGKSQIKYLKTKGKSRAGSRVRLGETKVFFEEIAERLQEYGEQLRIDKVFISCSTTLIPFLFENNPFLKISKSNHLITKVPFHIQQPTHENLLKAQRQLTFNQLLIKQNQVFDSQLLKEYLSNSNNFLPNQEDW